jgi:hypothetical protein
MKKILLLASGLFVQTFLFAQPVISSALPGVGSTYAFNSVSGAITHPLGGASQNWNFNPLSNSALLTYSVIPQSDLTATDISTFPNANYYVQSFLSGNPLGKDFKEIDALYFQNWGSQGSGGSYNVFTQSQLIYEIGQTFGTTAVKNFVSSGGSSIARSVKYDGYGNITLPGGTFNNVIRTRVTDAGSSDSLFIYYGTSPVMHPLLQYVVTSGGTVQNKFLYQYTNLITGIAHLKGDDFKIYPNPASDFLNIELPDNENYNFEIYDVNGQLILSDTKASKRINLPELSQGIYMLKVWNSKQVFKSQRFIIQ